MDGVLVLDESRFKQQKVVDAGELETHTRSGWVVLRVLAEQRVERVERQEMLPAGQHVNQHGYQTNIANLTDFVVVSVHRYLVGLDETSAVARLNDELQRARGQSADLDAALRQHEAQTAELKRCNAELSKTVNRDGEIQRIMQVDIDILRKSKQKLEADIGKIRAAIGSKQMTEILGEG